MKKSLLGKYLFASVLCSVASSAMASFTETAVGNAVVFDASAVYYNPASLTLLPNKQFIASGALVNTLFSYNGISRIGATSPTFQGTSNSKSTFFLPSLYYAAPVADGIAVGIGEVYTFDGLLNYTPDSVLAAGGYRNNLDIVDITPSIGIQINKILSVGAGLDFERFSQEVKFNFGSLTPRVINKAYDWSTTGHAGILLTPARGTFIGFTYHAPVGFDASGSSTGYGSATTLHNNTYNYSVVFPASQVLSWDQFFNPKFGVMTTIERMQWSSISVIRFNNIVVGVPVFGPVQLATLPVTFNLRDAWRYVIGLHYTPNEKWMLRGSVMWDQSPIKPLVVGPNTPFTDGWILGLGAAYNFNKNFTADLGYAHAWYQGETVRVTTSTSSFTGRLRGLRDVYLAKLTWNIV